MSRTKWQLARQSCLSWQFYEPPDRWPEHFSPRQLANLQAHSATDSRALDTERSALIKAIEDAVKAKEIPHVVNTFTFPSMVISWGGSREFHSKQLPAIAANDFAQWLKEQRETPSKHIQAWFDSCCTHTAPLMAEKASAGMNWTLNKPQRFPGYRKPLYDLLKAAHIAGQPSPKARDVLDKWKENPPPDVATVTDNGLKYYDANGNTKPADLEAIRKAIDRMIR